MNPHVSTAALDQLFNSAMPGFHQISSGAGIDEIIDQAFSPAADFLFAIIFYPLFTVSGVEIPFILVWLVTAAIGFTGYLNFINIRGFGTALRILKGEFSRPTDPGEVTHFQALTAALSGTVGLGNIAGVALAIAAGGPGATFWMILFGLCGMSVKFVECTLAVKFREVHADGSVSGGPMYYLKKGLASKGYAGLGKLLALFFALTAIGASIGGGNMFQVNQAAQQFVQIGGGKESFLGQNNWIFGLGMAILVAAVIIGGIKSIAKVTERVVPFMCGMYVLAALTVLGTHLTAIPEAFLTILRGAFSGDALGGGFIGTMIMGMRRATFSNEAGVGSSAIAHAAVKTRRAVTEGFVASLEPFVDTVLVCTMTALVIVISGVYQDKSISDGVALTSRAFGTVLGWFPYVLSVAVILFAFSTLLSWSYYGLMAWTYVFGNSPLAINLYKTGYCLCIIVGAAASLQGVINFSDGMLFAMSLPNIIGCYLLAPLVKRDMRSFLHSISREKVAA